MVLGLVFKFDSVSLSQLNVFCFCCFFVFVCLFVCWLLFCFVFFFLGGGGGEG